MLPNIPGLQKQIQKMQEDMARAQTGLLGEEKAKVNPDLALDRGHPRSSVRSAGGRPTLCVYRTN